MKSVLQTLIFALLLLGGLNGPSTATEPAATAIWPHDGSDLRPDPAAEWGVLENGVRYVILPNRQPPGRASLRLYIDAGSMMESDAERGLAHFLEHMAFNGTKNFPAGQTVEYFQRLGMSFGAHNNAMTSFDFTMYQLELPKTGPEFLNDGLRLFRDILDGMSLATKEVEQERGVVLSELRDRNSAALRAIEAGLKATVPELKLSHRLPIGQAKVIQSAIPENVRSFYETWYTPGRATLVTVGDIDPNMVRDLVKRNFESAKGKHGEQPEPEFGKIVAATGPRASYYYDKEMSETTVQAVIVRPFMAKTDTVANERVEFTRYLINSMLNTRFQAIAKSPGAAILSGNAFAGPQFQVVEQVGVSATTDPARWKAALATLEQEVRRAVSYGFTAAEFQQAADAVMASLRVSAESAATRESSTLADSVVTQLVQNHVFTHPRDDLVVMEQLLAEISREDCQAMIREQWNSQDVRIFVSGNARLEGDVSQEILRTFAASQSQEVTPPADAAAKEFAYTDFGPAGKIVDRTEIKDLGIVQATFANNVRVNIKPTDFKANSVQFSVRIGGGLLEAPKDQPGLPIVAQATLISGGLAAHDMAELNRLLSARIWSVAFTVAEDAFQFSGESSTGDLDVALQVAAAYMKAPAFRPEALEQLRAQLGGIYAQLEHTPEGMLQGTVEPFTHDGDSRFGFPTQSVINQRTLDEVKAWLAKPFHEGYLEIGVVGDVDPEKVLASLAKTFGAFPQRDLVKPPFERERQVRLPRLKAPHTFEFTSDTPRAASVVLWPAGDSRDIRRVRRTTILSRILDDRLRVKLREELGDAYSPVVLVEASETFLDFGYIGSILMLEPEKVEPTARLVTEIAAEIRQGSISDDEFQRALAPEINGREESERDNGQWLDVINNCQEKPECLDWARSRVSDCKTITKEEVHALAQAYLASDNALVLHVIPQPPAGEPPVSAVTEN